MYVVDRIISHIGIEPQTKTFVRRYGYETEGNIVNIPEYMPKVFTIRCRDKFERNINTTEEKSPIVWNNINALHNIKRHSAN